ncbi:hypothetical protein GGI07_002074 [Coemansia sp. Benny D115]|nr:hypothetical protein GGI07_002074 [Coemansia sp. Benny D115]
MSLSLVLDYASSSESDSDSEPENQVSKGVPAGGETDRDDGASRGDGEALPTAKVPEEKIKQRGLGAMLSSILPPPKTQSSSSSKTVKIVVDLPHTKPAADKASSLLQSKQAGDSDDLKPSTSLGLSRGSSGGGIFSQLSSILPAPKNTKAVRAGTARVSADVGAAVPRQAGAAKAAAGSFDQPFVPHSLSGRRKEKTTAAAAAAAAVAKAPVTQSSDRATVPGAVQEAGGARQKEPPEEDGPEQTSLGASGGPFFTISATPATEQAGDAVAGDHSSPAAELPPTENAGTATEAASEMYYDPASGYYYDAASGRYYYYDIDTQSYIDAAEYQALDGYEDPAHGPAHDATGSEIAEADLVQMIGRGGMRRGELAAALNSSVQHVAQSAQLQNSGYSEARAAAEYRAKREAELKRRQTKRVIESSEVDSKKKQRHNIMYLALQAQEQEAKVAEASANRRRSKKEAQAKYAKRPRAASPAVSGWAPDSAGRGVLCAAMAPDSAASWLACAAWTQRDRRGMFDRA